MSLRTLKNLVSVTYHRFKKSFSFRVTSLDYSLFQRFRLIKNSSESKNSIDQNEKNLCLVQQKILDGARPLLILIVTKQHVIPTTRIQKIHYLYWESPSTRSQSSAVETFCVKPAPRFNTCWKTQKILIRRKVRSCSVNLCFAMVQESETPNWELNPRSDGNSNRNGGFSFLNGGSNFRYGDFHYRNYGFSSRNGDSF